MTTACLFLLLLGVPSWSWATATVFDATDDKVEVVGVAALSSTTTSLCMWVYRIGNGEGGSGMLLDRDGDVLFEVVDDGSTFTLWPAWTGAVPRWSVGLPTVNTWTHYCFTYDAGLTSNDPEIYKNAVLENETQTNTPAGSFVTSTTQEFVIGNRVNGAVTWNGRIANVQQYNRILSVNEVEAIKDCPKAVPNGLVLYWPMGVFAGNNYTTTAVLTGTETGSPAKSATGPPIRCPQGGGVE